MWNIFKKNDTDERKNPHIELDITPENSETESMKSKNSPESSIKNQTKPNVSVSKIENAKVGDIVCYGQYYQTDDSSKEDIEWRVLAVENGKALLLSEKILDCKPYNEKGESVTWETCTLRKWLNNDFYSAAFTSDEQERIALTKVKNENNPWNDTEGGNDTNDKLFPLSYNEVTNTTYGFDSNRDAFDTARQAQGSVLIKSKALFVFSDGSYSGNSYWWLRTPGSSSYGACDVGINGGVYNYIDYVNISYIGVRPALWLNL